MRDAWMWMLSDRSLPIRIAIGLAIFAALATADIWKNGDRATRWREYLFLAICVGFAITYGIANDLIPKFEERFKHHWLAGMRSKLGLFTEEAEDAVLIQDWLNGMKEAGADFTRQWNTVAPIAPLNKILAANYPAYTTAIPDLARAQIFLADLKRYEQEGKLPNLILLQLPSNHTNGTTPGASTPKAMVADNDLALGQIVEGLSKSKFWPKMAIFVVEDDAQNGVDHVDGHRTTAFVASPYARKGQVDSTFYSHQSMLKSIELILGLPTMSIFDLIANDMRASFTTKPDLTPFTAVEAKHDLFETNPKVSALRGKPRQAAVDSAKMNFNAPDAAPTERLNRILWGQIKGWNIPYPAPRRTAFSPLSIDIDDEDREEQKPKAQRTR